jgi:hypothetical protein
VPPLLPWATFPVLSPVEVLEACVDEVEVVFEACVDEVEVFLEACVDEVEVFFEACEVCESFDWDVFDCDAWPFVVPFD